MRFAAGYIELLVKSLLDVDHGGQSSAATCAHCVLAPWAFDGHRDGPSKVRSVTGTQNDIGIDHGIVKLAGHIVIILASAAFNKDFGNCVAIRTLRGLRFRVPWRKSGNFHQRRIRNAGVVGKS